MPQETPLPAWDEIRRDYIEPGLPHRLVVRATPGLHVFTDTSGSRLGARFELAADAPPAASSKLQQIAVQDVGAEGRRWLEIAASAPQLFESFYHLITQISAAVLAGEAPHDALGQAVSAWDSLVEEVSLLSEERQAGLFGELLFLERLALNGTADAVAAWVGPDRQPHDFRLQGTEFEIKTTGGAKRVHRINGLGQLEASVGCQLYLISMQTTDAGAGGRTLPELANRLRSILPHEDVADFDRRLEAYGYIERHAAHYPRRRRLRSDMAMIRIEDGAPRLTSPALAMLPPAFGAERIVNVVYDIDVSGLGVLDGGDAFLAIIPAAAGTS